MSARPSRRRWLVGMAFLLPNFAGFCAFTLVPLALSFCMAFTDWDIFRHNVFRHEALHFMGFDNFKRLFSDPQFWRDLGNTFFLLMGLPFGIAGSLGAALLLTRVGKQRCAVGPALAVATVIFVASGLALLRGGMSGAGLGLLFGMFAAAVLAAGVLTGGTVYRTLFYLPSFTAGIATFVLWKKLYSPHGGPINLALAPALDGLAAGVRAAPSAFKYGLPVVCGALALLLSACQVRRLRRRWDDGETGGAAIFAGALVPAVPMAFLLAWHGMSVAAAAGAAAVGFGLVIATTMRRRGQWGPACGMDAGLGMEAALSMVLIPILMLLAAGIAFGPGLPVLARAGFEPPNWLGDYAWAKPSLMIMALWAAIGSNSMILYIAALSNISPELYEAANMDGASAGQRFSNVTWPQLAPTTFFIVVIGVIQGLQGGFEMARPMTQGGPAGATTTISYFIFTEGFETGRLGYASAVAWFLFILVFICSLLNFRFLNRHADD
jgi:multiple sugar transport system permease protein